MGALVEIVAAHVTAERDGAEMDEVEVDPSAGAFEPTRRVRACGDATGKMDAGELAINANLRECRGRGGCGKEGGGDAQQAKFHSVSRKRVE